MAALVSLSLGILFGIGLIAAGMTDPAKIKAFLDVAGNWDPSLALVMAGAIGVGVIPFQWARRWGRSWLGEHMPPAPGTEVDAQLVLGSLLFGIGWGLSGFCPGPALVGLGLGYVPAIAFVIAMVFGMEAYEWWREARERNRGASRFPG